MIETIPDPPPPLKYNIIKTIIYNYYFFLIFHTTTLLSPKKKQCKKLPFKIENIETFLKQKFVTFMICTKH